MGSKVERPGVRAGYDAWSCTYDETPNPLVALDRRNTLPLLRPRRGERILDAGCGTGGNLHALLKAGTRPVGVEFRLGALRHGVDDYLSAAEEAGFARMQAHEFKGDEALAAEVPAGKKYLGKPLLLVIEARACARSRPALRLAFRRHASAAAV